jgi:hypothetical protein
LKPNKKVQANGLNFYFVLFVLLLRLEVVFFVLVLAAGFLAAGLGAS